MSSEQYESGQAQRGWDSNFREFRIASAKDVVSRLKQFVTDAPVQQIRAWTDTIPQLQNEVGEAVDAASVAGDYTAILEYQLPMDSRRADAVFLAGRCVLVIELKGKSQPSDADIDQAQAYARDLKSYHAECATRDVHPVLIPTRARGHIGEEHGVYICGPDVLDELIIRLSDKRPSLPAEAARFLSESAYRPLPTLVQAARELFHRGELRRVYRAAAVTDPAVEAVSRIVHDAARTKSRRLVLVTGVPGAGKTLVGLRLVHAHFIDDLASPRDNGPSTSPAVYLSGNGPLVQVLQYELRGAGGGGRTFVRGVKDYVARYERNPTLIPNEHVLVFDEAQRAYDAAAVANRHGGEVHEAKSEPEHFIEFAERIPDWAVVVGLIGGGQEIHIGEEAGLSQWATAISKSRHSRSWTVHAPPHVHGQISSCNVITNAALSLDKSLRSHMAFEVHRYVADLVGRDLANTGELATLANDLLDAGYHLKICRDLEAAKQYLRSRYNNQPDARFGILTSSRDKDLIRFGVNNDFRSRQRVKNKIGAWYGDSEDSSHSCRHLNTCITEFEAQGLELDGTLLAWGTDFMRHNNGWSVDRMSRYVNRNAVRDPWQLRANAYRVLLTRARDVTVVFVPPISELNETYQYLLACGFHQMRDIPSEAA